MSDATLACSGASFVAHAWQEKYLELFGPKSEELGDDALGRGELATQAVDWVCTKGFDGACYVRGEFHSADGCEHENTPADYEATKDVRAVWCALATYFSHRRWSGLKLTLCLVCVLQHQDEGALWQSRHQLLQRSREPILVRHCATE